MMRVYPLCILAALLAIAGCAERPEWLQPTPTGSYAQPSSASQSNSLPPRIYVANESIE